jgi:hypothetical protein
MRDRGVRPLLCLLAVAFLGADEGRIDWLASTPRASIGDTVGLVLRYRWPDDAELTDHAEPHLLLREELLGEISPVREYRDGDSRVREWRMQALAQRSGSWLLPTPTMTLRLADGTVHTVTAPTLAIAVEIGDLPASLPPPSGLYLVPPPAPVARWPWWVGGGGLLLAAAMTVAALRFHRRRTTAPAPHAIFLRELEQALVGDDGRAAAGRVSVAARRYCGTCFTFDGPGATTSELDLRLRACLPPELRREGRLTLERLDALRWAPGLLHPAQVAPLAEAVRHWVIDLEHWQEALRAAAAGKAAA